MKLKFWGVRGSIPSPILPGILKEKISQAIAAAAESDLDLRNPATREEFVSSLPLLLSSTIGGNTTCITIETEDVFIVFDAGSGMRELGNYLMTREFGQGKGHAHLFFTHTHWDHIQGFPFFVPAFISGNRFDIYHIHPYVPEVLAQQMTHEVFPADFHGLDSTIVFHQLVEGQQVELSDLSITNIELHHPGKAYSYRVNSPNCSIVLATDAEYKKLDRANIQHYLDFYNEADLLIFDAQFSMREAIIKEDWGHSSALIGADIARLAKVKRLVLFHHDPTSPDEEIVNSQNQAQEYLAQQYEDSVIQIDIAREGWELDFDRTGTLIIEKDVTTHDVVCLRLSGNLDTKASEMFAKYISVETDQSITLVVDMSNLDELTMAGVRALLDTRYQVNHLFLIKVPEHIHRVMKWANITDFFAIFDSLDAATQSISSSDPS